MYRAEIFFVLWLKKQHIASQALQMFVNKVRGSLNSKQIVTCGHLNSGALAQETQNIRYRRSLTGKIMCLFDAGCAGFLFLHHYR